ncbi:MAG TPA: carboxypeptidase-like regulatory domain-containing protein [Thermoguttaceae bacterium]|nr:carboxypeptidase-like regulatory domain-containing protein [Thermoguttaceae bacterium]
MVSLAAVGLCIPSVAFSAAPAAQLKVAADVALLNGNVLVGQLVNENGTGVANASVLVQQNDKTVVALKTDKQGVFAAKDVPPGVYRLASNDTQGVYRLWAPKTAPPAAQQGALLVQGNGVVRGQAARGLRNMLANPWIVAGIVACAVAIPVAIHNADHDSPASP